MSDLKAGSQLHTDKDGLFSSSLFRHSIGLKIWPYTDEVRATAEFRGTQRQGSGPKQWQVMRGLGVSMWHDHGNTGACSFNQILRLVVGICAT